MVRSCASPWDRPNAGCIPTMSLVPGHGLAVFEVGCGAGATQGPMTQDRAANKAIAADIGKS